VKEGFPAAHAANVANTANLANWETGGGSSAKSWLRYSHSEKVKRKRKGERNEGRKEREGGETGGEGNRERKKGSGWESWGGERQRGGMTGRADGKTRDGCQRGERDAAASGRSGEWVCVEMNAYQNSNTPESLSKTHS